MGIPKDLEQQKEWRKRVTCVPYLSSEEQISYTPSIERIFANGWTACKMWPFCSGLFWLRHAHVPASFRVFAFQYRGTWERGCLIIFLSWFFFFTLPWHVCDPCLHFISYLCSQGSLLHWTQYWRMQHTTAEFLRSVSTVNNGSMCVIWKVCIQLNKLCQHVCDMKGTHSIQQAVPACVWYEGYTFKSVIETSYH